MQKGFAVILVLVIVLIAAVGAGAYYFGYDHGWEKSGSRVQSPNPSPIDETANWKTYTNIKFGYSLKYPSNWEVIEKNTGTLILGPRSNEEFSSVIQVLFWDNRSTEDFIKNDKSTAVSIGGLNGKRTDREVFVNHKAGVYQISLIETSEGEQISVKEFNQILSTFRFN